MKSFSSIVLLSDSSGDLSLPAHPSARKVCCAIRSSHWHMDDLPGPRLQFSPDGGLGPAPFSMLESVGLAADSRLRENPLESPLTT